MHIYNTYSFPFSQETVDNFLSSEKARLRLFPFSHFQLVNCPTYSSIDKTLKYSLSKKGAIANIIASFKPIGKEETQVEISVSIDRECKKSKGDISTYMETQMKILRFDLEVSQRYHSPKLKILLSGASGLIGTAFKSFLEACDHTVIALSTKKKSDGSIFWDPINKIANVSDFEGFDAIVNLAGEPIADGMWTRKKKRKIYDSRVQGTLFLSSVIALLEKPPEVVINASAIGIYGDRGAALLDENSLPGKGFLADVCVDWERAFMQKHKTRFVVARLGVVLSSKGGLLQKLLIPFQLNLGAILGSGKQYLSWISLDDVVYALYHLIMDPRAKGVYNIASPKALTQAVYSRSLALKLGKSVFIRVPKWLVRLVFGQKSQMLLFSQRVVPSRIQEIGFRFYYPAIEETLKQLLL